MENLQQQAKRQSDDVPELLVNRSCEHVRDILCAASIPFKLIQVENRSSFLNNQYCVLILHANDLDLCLNSLRLNKKIHLVILGRPQNLPVLQNSQHIINENHLDQLVPMVNKLRALCRKKNERKSTIIDLRAKLKKDKYLNDIKTAERNFEMDQQALVKEELKAFRQESFAIGNMIHWVMDSGGIYTYLQKLQNLVQKDLNCPAIYLCKKKQADHVFQLFYFSKTLQSQNLSINQLSEKGLQAYLVDLFQRPILNLHMKTLSNDLLIAFESHSANGELIHKWWGQHQNMIRFCLQYLFLKDEYYKSISLWKKSFHHFKHPLVLFSSSDIIEANDAFLQGFAGDFASPNNLMQMIKKEEIQYKGELFKVKVYPMNLISGHQTFLLHLQSQEDANSFFTDWLQTSKMTSIGNLAGTIAHELNNPLAGIKISAEYLLQNTDYANEDIEEIFSASKRALKIINSFKNFSNYHIEEMYQFPLADLIQSSLSLCKTLLQDVELNIDIHKNIYIRGNFELLQQVLFNLISNSAEAMSGKGKIWISAVDAGDVIQLEILDSGPGISKEIHDEIFQPFFSTKQRDGTGLGLNICRRIMQMHDGEIFIQERAGSGAHFILRFRK
tara:strand:- start:3961 stop:5805 length:1845 start_codon:yes stop_codon:yes gene_type:complete